MKIAYGMLKRLEKKFDTSVRMSYISGCKLILGVKRRQISLADERSDVAGAPRRAKKRTRIVRPYPNCTLEEAVTVAAAIQEANSGLPFDRVLLAEELGTTTRSSGFTIRLNAAARYGLTQGAYNDDSIALTPRGPISRCADYGRRARDGLDRGSPDPRALRTFLFGCWTGDACHLTIPTPRTSCRERWA